MKFLQTGLCDAIDLSVEFFLTYDSIMWSRWTAMNRRACATNTMFLDIQPLNGFQKDRWNPKSEDDSTNQNIVVKSFRQYFLSYLNVLLIFFFDKLLLILNINCMRYMYIGMKDHVQQMPLLSL
jgi:hypothetical protein